MLHFLVALLFLYATCGAAPLASSTTTATGTIVAPQPIYDTKFDNVDLDEILQQERLLKNYVNCLEGVGPCTPDAKMLKDILPDAIATDCSKCSEKQKYGSQKVTHHLIDNRPEDWMRLEKMYDPQGNYRLAYLAEKEKQLATGTKS